MKKILFASLLAASSLTNFANAAWDRETFDGFNATTPQQVQVASKAAGAAGSDIVTATTVKAAAIPIVALGDGHTAAPLTARLAPVSGASSDIVAQLVLGVKTGVTLTAGINDVAIGLGDGALNNAAAAGSVNTTVTQINAGLGGVAADTTAKVQALKDLVEPTNNLNDSLFTKVGKVQTALGDGNLSGAGAATTLLKTTTQINAGLGGVAVGTTAKVQAVQTALGDGALNGLGAATNLNTITTQINAGLGGVALNTTTKVQAVQTALGDGNLNGAGAAADVATTVTQINAGLGGVAVGTTAKVQAVKDSLETANPADTTTLKITKARAQVAAVALAGGLTADNAAQLARLVSHFTTISTGARAAGNYADWVAFLGVRTPTYEIMIDFIVANMTV